MRRFFVISLRLVLSLLLLSTVFMWVRSHFKSEAFGLAKMGPNDTYTKWWVQFDSRRGRCLLQVGRGWPLTIPAYLAAPSAPPAMPFQVPSFKGNQGARPTDEFKTEPPFFVDAIFPEHQTGHWYPPGDPPVEWFNKSGMFGFGRVSDQNLAHFEVHFPYWFALLLVAGFFAVSELKRRKSFKSASSRCSQCGYDLRATPQRCPECGTVPSFSAP